MHSLPVAATIEVTAEAPAELAGLADAGRLEAHGHTDPARAGALASKVLAMLPTLASSFFLFGILVVQAALLGRTLKPEGRGEYATVIAYTRFLTYIGLLGVNYAIIRRAAVARGRLAGLSRTALRAGLLTGLATMLAVVLLSWLALPEGKEHLVFLCIVCAATLPLEQVRLNLNAVDQGSGNYARFNAGRLVAAATFPLLLLVAWASGSLTVATATYLLIPATVLALVFRLVWSDDYRPWRRGKPPLATILREGLPFAPSQAGGDLFNKLDTLLVVYLASSVHQGLYVAAVPAVQVLAVAPEALTVFAFNAGARNSGAHARRHVAATAGGLLLFQLISALVYSFMLPTLIVWVYKSEFAGAIPFALALLPGMVCQGCTMVADGYLRGRGKAMPGIWARALGAAVMCLAALALCHARWALAVPVAASLGNTVSAVCIAVAVLQSAGHNPPRNASHSAEAYSP